MRCLCCGKEIKDNNRTWHLKCIKKFFGTSILPEIKFKDLNLYVNELGNEIVSQNKSVTGVQKKLSLHLLKEENILRLTLIGYPQGYILKPNSIEYPYIAEAEHLVMSMANECGISTPLHALIRVNDKYSYITKRIDRNNENKIHMEDFCQLAEKTTEYKYNSSYEKCAKIIDKYSKICKLDKIELFYRLLFCYITGNSDMHLKNFSLIFNNGNYTLSAAYDLLPVKLLINDNDDMALTLNGKNRKITKNDFIKFAENIGIEKNVANKLIYKLISKKEKLIEMIDDSFIPNDAKEKFKVFIQEKINIF